MGGGDASADGNIIQYITIASTGNATDFGDLSSARSLNSCCSSNTRGLSMGGGSPSNINTIEYITIGSTGNATDFGDLTSARGNSHGCSDSHGGLQ